jgi:hypothetical protein
MADFTSYTAKLEPFLLMSKGAKGAAAAKLVQDATAASGLFLFAQLLELPNIKEVICMPHSVASNILLTFHPRRSSSAQIHSTRRHIHSSNSLHTARIATTKVLLCLFPIV